MTNHLRIILKHILLNKKIYDQSGNYRVSALRSGNRLTIQISHLKFHGYEVFESCIWDIKACEIIINNANQCPSTEIIFIIRTIHDLNYIVNKVTAGYKNMQNKLEYCDETSKYFSETVVAKQPAYKRIHKLEKSISGES